MSLNNSQILNKLRELRVAVEYSAMITKLNYLNKAGIHSKLITYDEWNELDRTIIPEIDPFLKYFIPENHNAKFKKVYYRDDDNSNEFQYAVYLIAFSDSVNSLPEFNEEDYSKLNDLKYISSSFYEEQYEILCDALNKIEDDNKEIIESLQSNSNTIFSLFNRQ